MTPTTRLPQQLQQLLLLSLLLSLSAARETRLYTAQSDGNVSAMALDVAAANMNITSVASDACGANPSMLVHAADADMLYCYNRGKNGDPGTLHALALAKDGDGELAPVATVDAPASGVWAELVTPPGEGGQQMLVSASFNPGAIAVFALDDRGNLPGPAAQQVILPAAPATPGPIAERQDKSYLHHIIADPTGAYILAPDLGADMVRVFALATGDTPLTELAPLATPPGAGPRHGFFRLNDAGETFLFFNGELSQRVYSYRVTYAAGAEKGLTWDKVFDAPALGLDVEYPPNTAPTSECAMSPDGNFLVVSSREVSFNTSSTYQSGPSDSLATWRIAADGTLAFVQRAPSGGWVPRHFAFSRAGDMLAVGHNSANKSVVVWARDVATGMLGDKLGEAQLSGQVVMTLWVV